MSAVASSMTIGERIDYVRNCLHMTKTEFGESVGVGQPHVSRLTRDLVKPSPLLLSAIASTHRIRRQWLETGEGDMLDNHAHLPGHITAERVRLLQRMVAAAGRSDDDTYAELYDQLVSFEKRTGDFDNLAPEQLHSCSICSDMARWQLVVFGVEEEGRVYKRYSCFTHYDQVVAQLDADPAVAGREPVISICDQGWPLEDQPVPPETN